MSEAIEIYKAIGDHKKRLRAKYGVTCPVCPEKRPKAHPSILMPQQRCRVDGYVDPRPELTDQQYQEPQMNGISFIISQSGLRPLPSTPKQTPPGGGKLSVSQYVDIAEQFANGDTKANLARAYGVTHQAICYVIKKQQ